MYLIRLDDASPAMNLEKWNSLESILDNYNIKPLVGVIPKHHMVKNDNDYAPFWEKVLSWQNKDWFIALHGYEHKINTNMSGVNPLNPRSEFAGLELDTQKELINKAKLIFESHNIECKVFFAPFHSYDQNTLKALKNETNIRIISDTIASNVYKEDDFYYIPVQTSRVRKLPFKICTICLHPTNMKEKDFQALELFLKNNHKHFLSFNETLLKERSKSLLDKLLSKLYFTIRSVKKRKA